MYEVKDGGGEVGRTEEEDDKKLPSKLLVNGTMQLGRDLINRRDTGVSFGSWVRLHIALEAQCEESIKQSMITKCTEHLTYSSSLFLRCSSDRLPCS